MTPSFQIIVEGSDITALVNDRLTSLEVSDRPGIKTDTFSLVLDDRDNAIALPRKGAEVEITLGYAGREGFFQGRYTVDEIGLNGPPTVMTIGGKAANMRASLKGSKTRAWPETTLGDLVSSVASEHGYEPRVADELASIAIPQVDQTRESDMHLLTRLAREHDAIAKVADNKLILTPKGSGKTASGRDMDILVIPFALLGTYDVTIEDRGKYGSVQAHWHDVHAAEQVAVTVEGDGDGPVKILRHTYASQAEAEQAARARMTAIDNGRATLTVELPGRPEAAAENKLVLDGARAGLDGEWIIAEVGHRYTANGFTTRITADRKKR